MRGSTIGNYGVLYVIREGRVEELLVRSYSTMGHVPGFRRRVPFTLNAGSFNTFIDRTSLIEESVTSPPITDRPSSWKGQSKRLLVSGVTNSARIRTFPRTALDVGLRIMAQRVPGSRLLCDKVLVVYHRFAQQQNQALKVRLELLPEPIIFALLSFHLLLRIHIPFIYCYLVLATLFRPK